MSFYNSLINNVALPLTDFITGSSFRKHLKYYRTVQWYPSTEIKKIQKDRLQYILKHAVDKVPYYKSLGISIDEFDPYKTLGQFPVLKKAEIKSNIDNLVTQPKETLIASSSSGSSGIQGTVYLNKDELWACRALQLLWWENAGYRAGSPVLQTGMTVNRGFVKTVKDLLFQTKYLNAYVINDSQVKGALEWAKNKNACMAGYASSLYVIGQKSQELGYENVKFRSIISFGDKMFPHYRKLLEETFESKVYDTYACTEMVLMAAQCEYGRYHINETHTIVEILDDNNQSVPDGEMGHVVITRLDGFSMPIIRYYLGDLAIKSTDKSPCTCGRGYDSLQMIIGRDTDIVKTPTGKPLIVHSFTGIFEFVSEIKQFKVIQKELSSITIEYIRDVGFSDDIVASVKSKLDSMIDEPGFNIFFEEVTEILPTVSGKPQIIQSFLSKSDLRI